MLPDMRDTEGRGDSTRLGFPLNAPNCLRHFEVQQGAAYLLDGPRNVWAMQRDPQSWAGWCPQMASQPGAQPLGVSS